MPYFRVGDEFIYQGEGVFRFTGYLEGIFGNLHYEESEKYDGFIQLDPKDTLRVVITDEVKAMDRFGQVHPAFGIEYRHKAENKQERHIASEYVSLLNNRMIYWKDEAYAETPTVPNAGRFLSTGSGGLPGWGAPLFQGGHVKTGTWSERYSHPDPLLEGEGQDIDLHSDINVQRIRDTDGEEWVRFNVTTKLPHWNRSSLFDLRFEDGIALPVAYKVEGQPDHYDFRLQLKEWTQGEGRQLVPTSGDPEERLIRMESKPWDGRFPGRIPWALEDTRSVYERVQDEDEYQDFIEEHPDARLASWVWRDKKLNERSCSGWSG